MTPPRHNKLSPELRACVAVLMGIAAFASLVASLGLGSAVVACVVVTSLSRPRSELPIREALILGAFLSAAMYALFVGVLDQPIRFWMLG